MTVLSKILLQTSKKTDAEITLMKPEDYALWAISDLHLHSGKVNDLQNPMAYLGNAWNDHMIKILQKWKATIRENDIIALPGDLSWASSPGEAEQDLHILHQLPGRKILSRGNHDDWWMESTMPSVLPTSLQVVDASACVVEDFCFSGCPGWPEDGTPEGKKLCAKLGIEEFHKRREKELRRLEASLSQAAAYRSRRLIVLFHYPPFRDGEVSPFTPNGLTDFGRRIVESGADICVYGHLHEDPLSHKKGIGRFRKSQWKVPPEGIVGRTSFLCVSSDYLGFTPRKVL